MLLRILLKVCQAYHSHLCAATSLSVWEQSWSVLLCTVKRQKKTQTVWIISDRKYRTSALKISLYSMLNTSDFVKNNYLFISSLYHSQSLHIFWPIHSVIWKLALLLCMWDKQLQAPTASRHFQSFKMKNYSSCKNLQLRDLPQKDRSFINKIAHSHMTQPPQGTEVATSLLKL